LGYATLYEGEEITETGFLQGRVVDITGAGIPNITVDALASDTRNTTDEDGYYTIPLPDARLLLVRVYASIPTALSDPGSGQVVVFASEPVIPEPTGVTIVPDIIVDTVLVGGDIRFMGRDGKVVANGDVTEFDPQGNLLFISTETLESKTHIMVFLEESPGIFSLSPFLSHLFH